MKMTLDPKQFRQKITVTSNPALTEGLRAHLAKKQRARRVGRWAFALALFFFFVIAQILITHTYP